MKPLIIILFGLVLILFGCERNTEKNGSSYRKTQRANSPLFDYSANIQGQHKFIRFYKDSVVWGHDSISFCDGYGACVEMDDLKPHETRAGYTVEFSKNFIVVGRLDDDILRQQSLRNNGFLKRFFSLKEDFSHTLGAILSIDYNQEYILSNVFNIEDKDSKYPLVISKFPTKKNTHKYQSVEIPIDNDAPNLISEIKWEKEELILTYLDKKGNEKTDSIKIRL